MVQNVQKSSQQVCCKIVYSSNTVLKASLWHLTRVREDQGLQSDLKRHFDTYIFFGHYIFPTMRIESNNNEWVGVSKFTTGAVLVSSKGNSAKSAQKPSCVRCAGPVKDRSYIICKVC